MKQFVLDAVKQDEFDEPLPSAPGTDSVQTVETEGDASMFEGVGKLGETIPNGTFHFRLESVVARGAKPPTDRGSTTVSKYDDGSDVDPQPWFMVRFVCQQEPHTGKGFTEFVGWASGTLRKKAAAGDTYAKQQLKNRLIRIKAMMEASGYKPTGAFNLEEFFAMNPEVRIQIGQGKNKQSGEDQNTALKYFPINRPA